MAFWFGDGFDLYGVITDVASYWDGVFGGGGNAPAMTLLGRFSGSRGIINQAGTGTSTVPYMTKTSNVNDAVHHFSMAVQMTALTGTGGAFWITLYDGATAQCSVVFRTDGAILLTSGVWNGTTLATYTGALAVINVWYQFEIEVVIHNTAGSITVRKLGNTVNDFTLGSLNTRGGTSNNYANKIGIACASFAAPTTVDDFLWRSDASSLSWLGDIRCYTRMPASDVSIQFNRSGSVVPLAAIPPGNAASSTNGFAVNGARYLPFTAPCNGTISSFSIQIATASTTNIKAALYAASGSTVGAPIGTAAAAVSLSGVAVGAFATVTFGTPPPVTQGTQYYLGYIADTNSGAATSSTSTNLGALASTSTTYASWPGTSAPGGLSIGNTALSTINITPTATNAPFVADVAQDGSASYVYSNTPGQSDLYNPAPTPSTPTSVVAVTTRAYAQKSDAGGRVAAVQLQSGSANVQASLVLNTSWAWVWRNDTIDPNTGNPWLATSVDAADFGVTVTA